MKKTTLPVLFILAVIISIFSSCYTGTGIAYDPYTVSESRQKENFYYIPSAPNTPFLSEKNDIGLSVMGTSHKRFSGGEIQAAYMPGEHIGIMGSFSFANGNASNGSAPDYTKYNRFELGAGYLTKLSDNMQFETYAGLGNGKIKNFHYTGSSALNLTHFFIQPTLVMASKNRILQVAIISKFAGVNFKVTDTLFATGREPFSSNQLSSLYDQPFHVMWEPGLVLRVGWKKLRLHSGYSFSTDLTDANLYKANGNFSMGVCLRLNTNSKKEK